MSKVLFLNIHGHGHVNPTLGLVEELVKRGEEVTYYCYDEFKERIESTGATFKNFKTEVFSRSSSDHKSKNVSMEQMLNFINSVLQSSESFINDLLDDIKGINFDYIMYGASFPYGRILSQILKIPSVSSFAIFATPKELEYGGANKININSIKGHPVVDTYTKVSNNLMHDYGVEMPGIVELFFNKGDLNIAYTSEYFIPHPEYYDSSFKFIGPPTYEIKENSDFPFNKLKDKKVIYISLGTVFNKADLNIYNLFFEAFGNADAVVVMTAYNIDISGFTIPSNFIVSNYVPQSEILKYTTVAITHAGMNSTNDLIYNNIPFIAIPFGADQPYIASRVEDLGATIVLNKDKLSVQVLRASAEKIMCDSSYLNNIKKINNSFKQCGGYKEAVDSIFELKSKNIV
ncbi:macrolide family glycosyltransferase [Clostridium fungisolvens]|uniref:Oleandomycin glycosyltransferase n=1 Tax=Clostridium fungisolvens TaxID=1604897 RepID=A0A6V8SRC5_9CLOT|nr:macrolide family glycosyltransferase [Clostridium fungisolvens]GFP77758.1 Oleandomycin glycosyltransferase [Clostridium fungisolvens]